MDLCDLFMCNLKQVFYRHVIIRYVLLVMIGTLFPHLSFHVHRNQTYRI